MSHNYIVATIFLFWTLAPPIILINSAGSSLGVGVLLFIPLYAFVGFLSALIYNSYFLSSLNPIIRGGILGSVSFISLFISIGLVFFGGVSLQFDFLEFGIGPMCGTIAGTLDYILSKASGNPEFAGGREKNKKKFHGRIQS